MLAAKNILFCAKAQLKLKKGSKMVLENGTFGQKAKLQPKNLLMFGVAFQGSICSCLVWPFKAQFAQN
jgi:hypothetical protein